MSGEVVAVPTTKFCNSCKKDKSIDLFYKDTSKKDGLRGPCKDCKKLSYEKIKKETEEKKEELPKTKKCWDCKVEKNIELFCKDISKLGGYKTQCKECSAKYTKERYKNPEIKEYIIQKKREYRKNPEFVQKEREAYKKYYHRPEIKKRYEEYRNRSDVKEYQTKYYNDPINKERRLINLIEYRPIVNERLRKKYEEDLDYRLKQILRSRLKKALNGRKTKKSLEYIGCDIDFLKKWIEFRFEHDMNWDNYATVWHIDHILPIDAFDFTKETDITICNNWTNLQPLYINENLSKNNKIQLHYYFNNIVNIFRFNKKYNQFLGYQVVSESLQWLKYRIEVR